MRKKHREDIDIIEIEKRIVNSHAGISRRNITSLNWHCRKANSEMANHFLGFSDFNEFTIYVKAFWPDIVFDETTEETTCFGEEALTKFEKVWKNYYGEDAAHQGLFKLFKLFKLVISRHLRCDKTARRANTR